MNPRENLETARRFGEAIERGDMEAAARELADEVEIDDTDIPDAGHDSFYTWMSRWNDSWESWRTEGSELVPVGDDKVLSTFRMIAKGKGSGIELGRDDALLTEFRDGKIARIGYYNDQAQAREAANRGANAALVRRWVEAVNDHDLEASLALCDPAFEMTEAAELPGAARVVGLEALQRYYHGWQRNWSDWNWQIDELTELDGDRVLLVSRLWLRGLRGGTPVERSWSYVFTIGDEKLLRQDGYNSRDQALAAAGGTE